MSCDIHLYIEHRPTDPKARYGYEWQGFGGRINPGRDYEIFGLLAGVRGGTALVKPRGFPTDASFEARCDNQLYLTDNEVAGERETQKTKAQEWVDRGNSEFLIRDGKPYAVTHPDWHTHSRLTSKEFEAAIFDHINEEEYWAILAAMKSFEKSGHEARVVFWFDS